MKGSLHPSAIDAPGLPARGRLPIPRRGTPFDHWTVCGKPWTDQRWRTMIPCKCTCGTRASVRLDKLVAGRSTQCRACAHARWHNPLPRLDRRDLLA